jgi:O-antigen/teichoic acid export membrane protein
MAGRWAVPSNLMQIADSILMPTDDLIVKSLQNQTKSEFRPSWGRVRFAVLAGWGNRGVSILANLLQTPMLYHYLDSTTLGLWFLMIGAQTVLGLFDLGFGTTIQRRIAFARGLSGTDPDVQLIQSSKQQVLNLLAMAKRFYSLMAIIVFVIFIMIGVLFQSFITVDRNYISSLWLAWIIISIGFSINVLSWYVDSILNGLGVIGWSNIISIILGVISFVCTWIALSLDTGLIGLAIVWVLRGIVGLLLGWLAIIRLHPWIKIEKGVRQNEDFVSMVRPSLQLWIGIVASFLLVGMPRYIIAMILGVRAVPDFSATYLALSNIQAVFLGMVTASVPLISQAFIREGAAGMRKYILPPTKLALGLLIFFYGLILLYGREIFQLWLGPTHYVGSPVLTVLCIMLLLEAHHGMLSASCIAVECLGFCKYTLLGSLISVILMLILTPAIGLLGTVLAIALSRMFTDNWIIPHLALKLMQIKLNTYAKAVIWPAFCSAGCLLLLSAVIKMILSRAIYIVFCEFLLLVIAACVLGWRYGLRPATIRLQMADWSISLWRQR